MGASGAFSAVLNDLTNLPQAVIDAQAARDAAEAAQTAAEDAATAAAASMPGAPGGTAQLDPSAKLLEAQVPDRLSSASVNAAIDARTGSGKRPIGRDELLVNVKDYGAVGDGVTDDTAAITAAIAAATGPAIVFFPPGTYLVSSASSAIFTAVNNHTYRGAGSRVSILKVAAGSTAAQLLSVSSRSGVTVEDLGFDGSSHATTLSAVRASTSGTTKSLTVRRCRFINWMPAMGTTTAAAVYTWTTDDVRVTDNEFVDCGRAITIDQPDGTAIVRGNRITSVTNTMQTGIWVRRSSSSSDARVVVDSNYVAGADRDPSGNGAEGHAIAVFRCRDVKITNNHCRASGRGILVSYEAFGCQVTGNTCEANTDAGIRVEPQITETDITVGVAERRGCTVAQNVCRNNVGSGAAGAFGIGIEISYAAGSTVVGNISHDNGGDGIHIDSDRVAVLGNVCFNNYSANVAPVSGAKAGIRYHTGVGATIVGNQCFDSRTTKTQDYGLSLSTGSNTAVVFGNNFTGNGVGDVNGSSLIRHGFYGTTAIAKPTVSGAKGGNAALGSLLTALANLGLITDSSSA